MNQQIKENKIQKKQQISKIQTICSKKKEINYKIPD